MITNLRYKVLSIILLLLFLTGCTTPSQTPVTSEVTYTGKGSYWAVNFTFNPTLYEDKRVNWVEIVYLDGDLMDLELSSIEIEFRSREGVITGNIGDMYTKVTKNSISFLVGTVNRESYLEDQHELIIKFNEKVDKIKLKYEA